jgi:purine nucleoside permease
MIKLIVLFAVLGVSAAAAQQPIEVKVVVVTMFEIGEDTTDTPGEFQYWIEREGARRQMDFPQGWRPLRLTDDGVLVLCTGMGIAKAAASIMALGMDPRFDLRRAYWVVAGIAGVDPLDAATGSAAWAEHVVDGDLAHEIDAREIPADWKTGYIPLRKTKPYEQPRSTPDEGEVFTLDSALVEWAYQLTRDIKLEDTPAMQAQRARFSSAAAHAPPRVLKGDVLSSSTYWHGTRLSEWANDWVKYFTDGRGNYVMTAMEDTGTLQALEFLSNARRADDRRVLVLRTASNFDQQRTGLTAPQSLDETRIGGYVAFRASVDAAHRVGAVVVRELVRGWSQYRDRLPNR